MSNSAASSQPRPAITPVYDLIHPTDTPRLHWFGEPGHASGPWTPEVAMAATIRELTVHWSEARSPAGKPPAYYLAQIGAEAYYHAFERDWNEGQGAKLFGDGLMYHYAIDPEGGIWQTTAETKRTWNARAANAWNLAVVLLCGHGDPVRRAQQAALEDLLAWMVQRADLPGVTARPARVLALDADGHTRPIQTNGVLTHDESLIRQGETPKGCPGPYGPVVAAWRKRQP